MLRTSLRPALAATALAAFLFAGGTAFAKTASHAAKGSAKTVSYVADLMGSSEVPPNDTRGIGAVSATYDPATKKFAYTVTYRNLTGPATAAHFHAPAAPGANAPPVVPVPATNLASPITGEATLTPAQAADLAAGKWYFNVHTAAHGPGEIRGQVVKE